MAPFLWVNENEKKIFRTLHCGTQCYAHRTGHEKFRGSLMAT